MTPSQLIFFSVLLLAGCAVPERAPAPRANPRVPPPTLSVGQEHRLETETVNQRLDDQFKALSALVPAQREGTAIRLRLSAAKIFENNAPDVLSDGTRALQSVGQRLNPYPEDQVTVIVYWANDVTLAEQRAEAVKLNFVASGVAASRVEIKSAQLAGAPNFPQHPEITDPIDVLILADITAPH